MEIGSEQVDKLLWAKKSETPLTAYFPLTDHIVGKGSERKREGGSEGEIERESDKQLISLCACGCCGGEKNSNIIFFFPHLP